MEFLSIQSITIDGREVEGAKFMRGGVGRLFFRKKDEIIVWMDYMEGMMNKENDLDHAVEGDTVEGPEDSVKAGRAPESSDIIVDLVVAGVEDGHQNLHVEDGRVRHD